ncbi:hypothetical protein Amn_18940 [Aminobacter sp. Y103A]|nr:hypothetical protein Amn_18940 [Aminobacter sp. SS-2016]
MTSLPQPILTAEEAAERLRITKRAVIKMGRQLGACSRSGRCYLFSEQDVLDIWEAMRVTPKEVHPPPPVPLSDRRLHLSLVTLTAKRTKRRKD